MYSESDMSPFLDFRTLSVFSEWVKLTHFVTYFAVLAVN